MLVGWIRLGPPSSDLCFINRKGGTNIHARYDSPRGMAVNDFGQVHKAILHYVNEVLPRIHGT